MNQNVNEKEITLKELWQVFIQRWWLIALVAVIFMSGMFVFKKLTFVPRYSSTATLYLMRQDGQSEQKNTTTLVQDFSIGLNVVNDCTHLLKSHAVVEETIAQLGLDMSYEALVRSISTYSPEESRVLEVTVVADTPFNAKKIVDRLCSVGQAKITEVFGFDQVRLFENGVLDTRPCNRTGMMTYLIFGFAAAVLVYLLFLCIFLFSDKLYSEEEIEKYLGLPILGSIPHADDAKKARHGYYAYGRTPGKKGEK